MTIFRDYDGIFHKGDKRKDEAMDGSFCQKNAVIENKRAPTGHAGLMSSAFGGFGFVCVTEDQ